MHTASTRVVRTSFKTSIAGVLVVLVLAPGVFGPLGALADPRPSSVASRECRDPLSEDSDPLEESEPLEDTAEEGQSEFLHGSSASLLRLGLREPSTIVGPDVDHRDRLKASGSRAPERAFLAGPGRALRTWLRSHRF